MATKKPGLYTVYIVKQNYYDGSSGDSGTTIVMSEYDDRAAADRSCQAQNNSADKNYSYSTYREVRSFPACFSCSGSGRERSGRSCRKCGKARRVWDGWQEWLKKQIGK